MSAGKIILLVCGIFVLLISFGLIAGGGTLLWANARYVDSDGFLTTDALRIERDSHAVVAGTIEIDEIALRVLRNIGVITVFKFEGISNNPSKQIFIGIADEADLEIYLDNVDYDEITSIEYGWHLDFDEIAYVNHPGSITPSAPASETIWTASAHGAATQTLDWQTEVGSYSIVMMNTDGYIGVDLDIIFKAKIPSIVGYGVGLLVGGILLLIAGAVMVFFAVREVRVQ